MTTRRRVFSTAGLTASAAVLALSLQAGAFYDDGSAPPSAYGDSSILDPDDGADSSTAPDTA